MTITDSSVTSAIRVDAQVPVPVSSSHLVGEPEPVQRTKQFHVRFGLSVTPRINGDGSVTLNLAPQIGGVNAAAGGPHAAILRTLPIGGMMVVAGLPLGSEEPTDDMELLVFVRPTLVGMEAPRSETGRPVPAVAGRTVSLDVSHGNLRSIAAVLERQVNLKTSVTGTDKMYKPVYIHLDGTSVSKALRTIAWSAGAQVVRNENGVYVFSPLSGTAQTQAPETPPDATGPSVIVNGSSVTVTP